MRDSWDRRIERANRLAGCNDSAAPLLSFYGRVLAAQKASYQFLSAANRRSSGSLEQDLDLVRGSLSPLLQTVVESGPQPLALEARRLVESDGKAIDAMLTAWWRTPTDQQFFPKAVLQPYAQWLAECHTAPRDREFPHADNTCPFCGGAPQLSILHASTDAEGGGRLLQCATCLTTWPFRRVLCPYCGEEEEKKLGYFHSPAFDHLRVDACDSCHRYIKAVDLTRLGIAVPLVDEIAGAPLDLWAREHGYEKIELNLVGL